MIVLTLLKRIGFSLVVVVLCLVVVNLAAAIIEWLPYGASRKDDRPAGLYLQTTSSERPQLRPGARLRGLFYDVTINALGFRGPELVHPRPANALRIWCAGGSTTFDIYAPDDESTWPGQLQAMLQEQLPDRAVEVINAGIPGEILTGNTEDLVRHFNQVRPNILVIYQGPNTLRKAITRGMSFYRAPGQELLEGFAIYRLGVRWLSPLRTLPKEYQRRSLQPHHRSIIRDAFNQTLIAAERLPLKVLLATHAMQSDQRSTAEEIRARFHSDSLLLHIAPQEVVNALDAVNGIVQQLARNNGLGVADVRKAVPADPQYWGDSTHFSAEGSRLAAKEIAQAILKIVSVDGP